MIDIFRDGNARSSGDLERWADAAAIRTHGHRNPRVQAVTGATVALASAGFCYLCLLASGVQAIFFWTIFAGLLLDCWLLSPRTTEDAVRLQRISWFLFARKPPALQRAAEPPRGTLPSHTDHSNDAQDSWPD